MSGDDPIPGREPYLSAARVLLRETGCTVLRWRRTLTGRAYIRSEEWGIEVPEPRGPVSFAIVAHEIAHQLLHRPGRGRLPRYVEEAQAWSFALEAFTRFALPGRERAEARARRAIEWSCERALRRGADPKALQERLSAFGFCSGVAGERLGPDLGPSAAWRRRGV